MNERGEIHPEDKELDERIWEHRRRVEGVAWTWVDGGSRCAAVLPPELGPMAARWDAQIARLASSHLPQGARLRRVIAPESPLAADLMLAGLLLSSDRSNETGAALWLVQELIVVGAFDTERVSDER